MLARLLLALATLASCTSAPSDPVLGSTSGSSDGTSDGSTGSSGGATEGSESSESSTGPAPQPAEGTWSECMGSHGVIPGKCDEGACVNDGDFYGYCAPPCNEDFSCPPGPGGQPAWCIETEEVGSTRPDDLGVYCFMECDTVDDCPIGMVCMTLTVLTSFDNVIPEATSFCV